MAATDLTTQAREGFASGLQGTEAAKACPYFTSSACGMAWLAGAWLNANGHAEPFGVRASRGYTMHANGMLLNVDEPSAVCRVR